MSDTVQVRIVDFPETRVAALEHRGDPARIGESVARFIAWRKAAGLPRQTSATFNILHNNPQEVVPEDFRLDICAATDREVPPNEAGIIPKIIPAGRCAVLRHTGPGAGFGGALAMLCAQWLPQSGEKRRDFPPFCRRVSFPPDVAEAESVTDIFLPLA